MTIRLALISIFILLGACSSTGQPGDETPADIFESRQENMGGAMVSAEGWATQPAFEEGRDSFCKKYENKCQGSICDRCVKRCKSTLNRFRTDQLRQIENSSLKIPFSRKKARWVVFHFKKYAGKLCASPKYFWLGGRVPRKCESKTLGPIESVIAPFIESYVEEDLNEAGDIDDRCAKM